MRIQKESAVIQRLIRNYSRIGISRVVGKQTFTGKRRTKQMASPTDRGKRQSTAKSTVEVSSKPKPKSFSGMKKKGDTKKSLNAKAKLPKLFDIGLADKKQPSEKLEFYQDQKSERKSRLPPVIGELGPERRRRQREEKAAKRKKIEEEAAKHRFQSVG